MEQAVSTQTSQRVTQQGQEHEPWEESEMENSRPALVHSAAYAESQHGH